MTFDDIIDAAIGVFGVAMFGIGVLWGIHNNPADTAIALLFLILLGIVVYVMRDDLNKWHEEQLAKNRR